MPLNLQFFFLTASLIDIEKLLWTNFCGLTKIFEELGLCQNANFGPDQWLKANTFDFINVQKTKCTVMIMMII